MNDFDLELADGKIAFLPGETVQGTVRWVLDKAPQKIEVVLFWTTQGKGSTDMGVAAREEWVEPGAFGEKAFGLSLPHAPLSFSGQLISLDWHIEALSHRPKRQTATKIIISPKGESLLLGDPQREDFLGRKSGLWHWVKARFGGNEG